MGSERHSESLDNFGNKFRLFSAKGFLFPQSVRRCPDFQNDCPGFETIHPDLGKPSPTFETASPNFRAVPPISKVTAPLLKTVPPDLNVAPLIFASPSPDFLDTETNLETSSPQTFTLISTQN
jgi:hypothetical protein